MQRILITFLETLTAGIFLIPALLLLSKHRNWDFQKMVRYLIFTLYLAGVYDVVGLPTILYHRMDPRINLIPFLYMFSDLENSLLNVVLFLPLGFTLPVLWTEFRSAACTILLGFGASALIETLQIFTFRATDINDLMTNTLGTLLGYLIAKIVIRFRPATAQNYPLKELPLLAGFVFFAMFFLQGFLSDALWQHIR